MRKMENSRKPVVITTIVAIALLLVIGAIAMLVGKNNPSAGKQIPENESPAITEVPKYKPEYHSAEAGIADGEETVPTEVVEITVVNAYINNQKHLIKVMSNGTEVDAGYVGDKSDTKEPVDTYTVTFMDHKGGILKQETVSHGGSATPPPTPRRDGFTFTGWSGSYVNVTSDLNIFAVFTPGKADITVYTVKFVDSDGTALAVQTVAEGQSADPPGNPSRTGYNFIGWDKEFTNVTSNLTVTALYEEIPSNDTEISVENVTAAPDSTVTAVVSIRNNPGILGMTLMLNYDESAMTLTKVAKGKALSEMTFTTPKDLSSGCQLPWDAEYVLPEDATNGEILVLTFAVSETAVAGDYPVTLSYDRGAIIDNDLMPVEVIIKNGILTVQ